VVGGQAAPAFPKTTEKTSGSLVYLAVAGGSRPSSETIRLIQQLPLRHAGKPDGRSAPQHYRRWEERVDNFGLIIRPYCSRIEARKGPIMRFTSVWDLRNRPGSILRNSVKAEEIALTSNGKPIALVVPVDGDTLEEELRFYRQVSIR